MLLFAIIMFLPTRQLTSENVFPSHFASILSCSACLVGIIWGKNTVGYLKMSLNTILTIRTQEIGSQKWHKMWKLA